ncbi:hypothetical protein DY000_02048088 [Brassica cretica]|uniref:Uncharacterized protein n=1 Tax=Brassica cretica TaxID=69181 RepID=A0ABQ7F7S1_BRACR|nr:hypothetical protein DY000_02048088 [Brassica cretica]
MSRNIKWVCYGLREISSKSRQECMDSCRIRCFGKARSLLSDRAGRALGRYVPTELGSSSVHGRSLRSDRAWLVRVSIGTLELIPGWFRYVSVTLGQLVFDPTETRTRTFSSRPRPWYAVWKMILLELPLSTSILLTRQFATISEMTRASRCDTKTPSPSSAVKVILLVSGHSDSTLSELPHTSHGRTGLALTSSLTQPCKLSDMSWDSITLRTALGSFRVPQNAGQAGKPDEFVWTELRVPSSGDLERSLIGDPKVWIFPGGWRK